MGFFSGDKRVARALADERALQAAEAIVRAEQMAAAPPPVADIPVITVAGMAPARLGYNDGEKFPGGFGVTQLLVADYWTLRARSAELFETNLYARGLIRRLVTNKINTGLHLEATPDESILGFPEEGLADWTEDTENLFHLWGKEPRLCDHAELLTFGELQAVAETEALTAGDVLVTLIQHEGTRLPRVKLINGAAVQTPLILANVSVKKGHRIVHGVELDEAGKHVAYWIRKDTGTLGMQETVRLQAYGPKTGRRMAWLYYGTDKRLDDVRGKPLLSLALQSLKEIDRYRDAVQRKAVLNGQLAMYVTKSVDKPGTKPIGGGAVVKGTDKMLDSGGTERTFNTAEGIPGVIIDELNVGEEPKGFPSHGTDEKFGDFESTILQSIAMACGLPPEIYRLAFTNNYSASQAAINEFKLSLNVWRTTFGQGFCQPIYNDWLLSQVLAQKIPARGLLDSWRDPAQFETFSAWVDADWSGHVKPAVDMSKLTRGYGELLDRTLITHDRAARELTGMKFSKIVKIMKREREQLDAAGLLPAEAISSAAPPAPPPAKDIDDEDIDDEDIDDEDDDKKSGASVMHVVPTPP